MQQIGFAGQVAIVTGASGGIGGAVARELARRGAQVLVNDAGGNVQGAGSSSTPSERVAEEICRSGGIAVANAIPVGTQEAGHEIVAAAHAAFGRVDILANIAGTVLPGEITSSDDAQIEAHFRTNLLGPYALVRAVWPVMRAQKYGRILNTSSDALFGIGANAPYATTRAGMLGLTLDAACEGREHGILVNAMMPAAYSRMTRGIPDPAFVEWFRRHLPPEKVAAVAAWLLSAHCPLTGCIFAVGGGRVARVAFAESEGWMDREISAESIAAHVDAATDMGRLHVLDSHEDSMRLLSTMLASPSDLVPIPGPSAAINYSPKQGEGS